MLPMFPIFILPSVMETYREHWAASPIWPAIIGRSLAIRAPYAGGRLTRFYATRALTLHVAPTRKELNDEIGH